MKFVQGWVSFNGDFMMEAGLACSCISMLSWAGTILSAKRSPVDKKIARLMEPDRERYYPIDQRRASF